MIGLRTSRFNENKTNNKIALNLFKDDIDDFDENIEYEEALTKRGGKNKNKSKIEYFKNYINNFKEKKFQTARQIEIFRKKEEKNKKQIYEKKDFINFINSNIKNEKDNNKNKFNKIKEIIEEGREAQIENMNNINNKRNEIFNYKELKSKKTKKEKKEIIFGNNEDFLKRLKKNNNKRTIEEFEKEKIRNKIMDLKNKNKNHNLSCGKISDFFDRNNEKFLQLIKAKKLKLNKKKLSKSFNKSNKVKLFNANEIQTHIIYNKTIPKENINRKIKEFRIKFNMKIMKNDDKNIYLKSEKEIFFNKKHKNKIKANNNYLCKSCFNNMEQKKDIFENDSRFFIKMKKSKK